MKKIVVMLLAIGLSSYSFGQNNRIIETVAGTEKGGVKKNVVTFKESSTKIEREMPSSKGAVDSEREDVLPIAISPVEAERKRMAENAIDSHKIDDPTIIKRREEEMSQKRASKGINKEEK